MSLVHSPSSTPQEEDFHRLEHDQTIQPDRQILDVEQVITQLLYVVLERCAIASINLRPPSGSGSHDPTLRVERHLMSQFFLHAGNKRTRADERHVAFENVD